MSRNLCMSISLNYVLINLDKHSKDTIHFNDIKHLLELHRVDDLIHLEVAQFTFPEAKFGVSCLDYLAFFDLDPASGKVLPAQLRKSYHYWYFSG